MPQDAFQGNQDSLLGTALRSVTRAVARRPQTTLWLVLVSAAVCAGMTVRFIGFKTERADLIDPNAEFHQRWLNYTENFGSDSDILTVVEADDPETIKQVLDDLGARMAREPELFQNVLYKVEPGLLPAKGLQYFHPKQLEAGLNRLTGYDPVLAGNWELIKLDSVVSRIRYQIQTRSKAGASGELRPLMQHTELLAGSLNRFLADRSDFRTPWPDLLTVDPRMWDEADQVSYLMNDDGTMGFLKAFPVKESGSFEGTSASINRLRKLIADVSPRYPSVKISMTGIPVLENDEMRRSQNDMLTASVIAVIGVGIVLFIGFRGVRHPLLALVMLAVGLSWAFGFTTAVVGHLNILSVSFAVILIGLGIDFGIHYLARYLQLRHEGRELQPALLETSTTVGAGIITAAVTTSLAFFCATGTPFLGVAELGVIAGGGILLCALATFLVLPALVALADQNVEPKKLPTPFEGSLLRATMSKMPLVVLLVSVAVLIAVGRSAVTFEDGKVKPGLNYDYNLLNLQAQGLESVEVQKRIFQKSQGSLLFAVSVADTPDEARRLRERFEELPSVHHVEELASRLPAHQSDQTKLLVQGFGAKLARLPKSPPQLSRLNPSNVGRAIEDLYALVRRNSDSASVEIRATLDSFLDRFDQLSLQQQVEFLEEYQLRMAAALLGQFQALAHASDSDPITFDDLPSELTSRFVSDTGKWLVQVYPQEQVWDIEPLTRFANDVRTVDPEATGTPLQNYEASRQIMTSYETAALYALAVIFVVLLIDFLDRDHKLLVLLPPLAIVGFIAVALYIRHADTSPVILVCSYVAMAAATAAILDFRNLRDAVLAMLPPLAGGLMMFGILALLKVDLNPANLIVLPLVLGIGVDDGVHVVHDFRLQRDKYQTSSSTINAIVLTSLTSMIGFGSMMVAAHRGLYSVGLVLVVGVGSCLFVSLVTLPAVLTLLKREQPAKPATETKTEAAAPRKSEKPRKARVA